MSEQNIIFALVGKSKAGKTTLMMELLKKILTSIDVIKSTATREKRENDETEDLFYDLMNAEEFRRKIANGDFVEWIQNRNGNYYGLDRDTMHRVLSRTHGICALDEQGVLNLRHIGHYSVKAVKITPDGGDELRNAFYAAHSELKTQDDERENISINFSAIIINSFAKGGKEKALNELTAFIRKFG